MRQMTESGAQPTLPAKLPILIAPHPTLRAKARKVEAGEMETVRKILPSLFQTMYEAPGIGLAAPQVGIGLRVVVIDLAENDQKAPLTLINPEITAVGEEWREREEGCLSLPGQYAEIARPGRISLRYLDESGTTRTLEAEDLLAACIQHEIDHLDGVLFVDHLSPLKRNMIMRRLAKEQRQKAEK